MTRRLYEIESDLRMTLDGLYPRSQLAGLCREFTAAYDEARTAAQSDTQPSLSPVTLEIDVTRVDGEQLEACR